MEKKKKKEELPTAKEKKCIKYAKGDFQLERKAQGVALSVSYLLLFLLCVFLFDFVVCFALLRLTCREEIVQER